MVRVIAGSARGVRLRAPKGGATRPTADRIKESLFNILGDVEGASVLDLFAGTGALGIEALSRGAKRAVFVEQDPRVALLIRENLRLARLEEAGIVIRAQAPVDAARLLEWAPFDLVLIDPPYERGYVAAILMWLDGAGILSEGARVSLERSRVEEIPAGLKNLKAVREKVYGQTVLNLFTNSK